MNVTTMSLKLSLTGTAFEKQPAAEVARILHNVAERIVTSQGSGIIGEYTLRDSAGLDVGRACFGDVNVDLEDIVEDQGPVSACGCGWPITEYGGELLHVFNERLTGSDDHEAAS